MRGYLLVIVPLLALAALAACAAANEETNTTVLEAGAFHGVEIKCEGASMRIEYDMEVITGPPIDVYFMDDNDYADLCAGNGFESYTKYCTNDSKAAHKEWYWSKKGTFYVVIGNGLSANQTASITYTVKWTDASTSAIIGVVLVFVVIAILIVVPILLVVRRRRRRAKGAMAPMAQTAAPGQPMPPGQDPPPGQHPPPPPSG